MKSPLNDSIKIGEDRYDVQYLYWPSIPASRTCPSEPAEVHFVMVQKNGENYDLPPCQDDGGDGEYERVYEAVINEVSLKEHLAQTVLDYDC